jgi:hypothetical protein
MVLALSLCWLGTGLCVLADAERARRVWRRPWSEGARTWLQRWLGAALVLASALPLVQREGGALGVVALLVTLMAVLSGAVLLFPLRPRWYAASVALSGCFALASLACALSS